MGEIKPTWYIIIGRLFQFLDEKKSDVMSASLTHLDADGSCKKASMQEDAAATSLFINVEFCI